MLSVSLLILAAICPCLSRDPNIRLLNQEKFCICDGVSSNYCWSCSHLSCDCPRFKCSPSSPAPVGSAFNDSCVWAVYNHTIDKVVFASPQREACLDAFFKLSTPSNFLDLVRYDLSKPYLIKSKIFVHK